MDTGSTRTIVSKRVVEGLSLTVCAVLSEGPLVALDGKAVNVLGTATVQLSRLDGPVHLEPVSIAAIVIDDRTAVATDVLIGSDHFRAIVDNLQHLLRSEVS